MIDLDNDSGIKLLTKKQLISVEIIEELNRIGDDDSVYQGVIIEKIKDRAKELKCLTAFNNLLKANKRDIDRISKEMASQAPSTCDVIDTMNNTFTVNFIGSKAIEVSTGKWFVSETNGVWRYAGINPITACRYPIVISQIFVDHETGKEEIELTWKKDNKIKARTAQRSVIASSTKLVSLSDYGLPTDSETARQLVSYLADYEKLNSESIPIIKSTSKFGWAEKEFVPYSNGITINPPQSYKALADSIKPSGDFGAWLELVKGIRATRRPEPLVYMAASFGSPLIKLSSALPFIVNIYGTTGKGKTVNLMLASSIWASPRKYTTESTSTLNALEQRLNILNNLPLMVDDLSKIKDKGDGDKYSEMIYYLCTGQGKSRLDKNINARDVASWENIILTNLERPLTNDTMQGGAINRVLDFDIQDGDIFQNARHVVEVVTSNYGHAGEKFIEILKDNYSSIKGMVDRYEKEIVRISKESGHKKEQKQIIPLAVLLTADELAERHIFQDGIRLDIDYCVSRLKDVESVSEMDRALRHICDEIAINRACYVPDDGKYRGKRNGFISENELCIIGAAFEEIGIKYKFNAKQFISWANDKGMLIHDKGRMKTRRSFPGTQDREWFYVLSRDAINRANGTLDGSLENPEKPHETEVFD